MQRMGRRHRPFYRINAIDQRTRRDGRIIENLGWYDPIATDEDKQLSLKPERIKYWLSVGAQPSETMRDILVKNDLMDKASWEADRKVARDRVEAKKAAAASAAAATATEESSD
jgi:small subunit ribosomal protein S16